MMSIVALIAFSYASRAVAAVDAFIIFTASDGKITKVKIHHDGSFSTSALAAGTYRWSFGATQSKPSSAVASSNSKTGGVTSSSGGDRPTESITLNFTKITMTYTIASVASPKDAASGLSSGKRQHTPVTIVREVDKASPKMMTALGTVVIDANGETLSGTVTPLNKDGGKSATDDWSQ